MAWRYNYGGVYVKESFGDVESSWWRTARERKEGKKLEREGEGPKGCVTVGGVAKVGLVATTRTQVWFRPPTPLLSSSSTDQNTMRKKRKWLGKRESRVSAMICVKCLQVGASHPVIQRLHQSTTSSTVHTGLSQPMGERWERLKGWGNGWCWRSGSSVTQGSLTTRVGKGKEGASSRGDPGVPLYIVVVTLTVAV